MTTTIGRAAVLGLTAVTAALLATGPAAQAQPAATARTSLTGLFRLQPGSWTGAAHGSYFRMLQPDGRTYLSNTSSPAGNKTYTLLRGGTDGGLRTGAYQATPTPAFAANGDARSGKVTAPTDFFGIKFATATNSVDPQTGRRTALPSIYRSGNTLSGNLSAFAASWNRQHFNQGSPKPGGTSPGYTRAVSGSYDAATRAFTLTWRSLIVGGPFNAFTGEWHLSGTFVPARTAATPAPAPSTHRAAAPAPAPRRTVARPAIRRPATGTAPHTPATTPRPVVRTSARSSTARTSRATSAHPSAAGSPTTAAVAARSDATAERLAAHATHDSGSGGTGPWLIGGAVVLAALATGALWFVRHRLARR